jgi:hypothetical protein
MIFIPRPSTAIETGSKEQVELKKAMWGATFTIVAIVVEYGYLRLSPAHLETRGVDLRDESPIIYSKNASYILRGRGRSLRLCS